MNAKEAKKIRRETEKKCRGAVDQVRNEVNKLPFKDRWKIAILILRGRW